MALTDPLQNKFRTIFADGFKQELDPIAEGNYFAFFGKCIAWTDENTPPSVVDSVSEHMSALRNSLFAIRLDSTNAMFVIPRYNWTTGTVYSEYSDSSDLNEPTGGVQYYVLVDETFVYKCINNNGGVVSTSKPTYTGTNIFSTSDGYKWKFLYKLTEDHKDFLTKEYLPVVLAQKTDDEAGQLQFEVQKNAIDGGIYEVRITNTPGQYLKSSPNEHLVTKSIGSTSDQFVLDASATSPFTNDADYYNDHVVYLTSGFGPEVGKVRRIIDQKVGDISGVSNVLTLESPFGVPVYGQDQADRAVTRFKILPEVLIQGDGVSAEAVMSVDGTYRPNEIQVLNSGKDYTFAYATFPTPGISGDAPTASVPVQPKGGHGSNPIKEFDVSSLMIRFLNENIAGQPEIINVNDFRQFGIIKDPVLNDNSLRIAGTEVERKSSYRVKRPTGFDEIYLEDTFKSGNKLYGFDTKSVADISFFDPDPGGLAGTIIVSNPSKNFKLPSTTEDSVRISFGLTGASGDHSGVSGSFTNNEIVTQYNSVLGLTAQGVVKGWNPSTRQLTIRLTATGDGGAVPFSASSSSPIQNSDISVIGGSGGNYLNLEEEGGEQVGTFDLSTGTFRQIKFEGTTSESAIGRIIQGENAYLSGTTTSVKPVYKMTTELAISQVGGGPSITDSSFSLDEGITQETGRRLTSANVASWTVSGTTGSLVLTNVRGGFTSGGTLEAGNGSFNVDTITEPDLVKGSGEVLYIQNVRPITRQQGQREEFRIRIGF